MQDVRPESEQTIHGALGYAKLRRYARQLRVLVEAFGGSCERFDEALQAYSPREPHDDSEPMLAQPVGNMGPAERTEPRKSDVDSAPEPTGSSGGKRPSERRPEGVQGPRSRRWEVLNALWGAGDAAFDEAKRSLSAACEDTRASWAADVELLREGLELLEQLQREEEGGSHVDRSATRAPGDRIDPLVSSIADQGSAEGVEGPRSSERTAEAELAELHALVAPLFDPASSPAQVTDAKRALGAWLERGGRR